MEDELIAQRDAAIAVTKELQWQLQTHQEEMERKFERRTLNAERLRHHAEEKLRRAVEDRDWSESCCRRLLALALFLGCSGAVIGWAVGLLLLLAVGEPLVGFLLVLPGMALGILMGLAVAKTKTQLESRRRDAKNREDKRHLEVEFAVSTGVRGQDMPLEPLENVPGMQDVAEKNSRQVEQVWRKAAAEEKQPISGPRSLLSMGWNATWFTLHTLKDITVGLYYGRYLPMPEDKKKRE
ncbi:unnamed protein product [Peronospora destructor]|uniref:Uncharacterized protein n=1 Tax=Peronospora destructor TaxID=86335 RepID=A0AAV0TD81_9STRA|nr:unnamed protein product [Peronospora destructor]CAI5719444.1 unnamed protein product [Peronospora destructor]